MRKYTVKSFTTRGSTCPSIRYRILVDGKRAGNAEFGNYREAETQAALMEFRSFGQTIGVQLDMTDGELLSKLRVLFASGEAERARFVAFKERATA